LEKKSGAARENLKFDFAWAVFSLQILHTCFAQETSTFRDFGAVIFRLGTGRERVLGVQ
jgi:hypothetical protein